MDRAFRQVANWLLSDPQRACQHEAAMPLSALVTEGVALLPEACSFAAAAGGGVQEDAQMHRAESNLARQLPVTPMPSASHIRWAGPTRFVPRRVGLLAGNIKGSRAGS